MGNYNIDLNSIMDLQFNNPQQTQQPVPNNFTTPTGIYYTKVHN